MQTILTSLGEEHADLAARLDGLDEAGWRRPTRCAGWSVADVVLHLAQTDELALASVEGRFGDVVTLTSGPDGQGTVDDGAARLVDRERGLPADLLLGRWRTSSTALRRELAAEDPHRRVEWVAGRLSVMTLATTRLAECWVHGGDIATAIGATMVPTDRLRHIARLAWRTLPYAFARDDRRLAGPVAFRLRGTDGTRWDLVPDAEPETVIEGPALDLCLVAARRADPRDTDLRGTGPDADAVLRLVRTYA